MSKDKVIAIDGPSGSGKSTVAKELARASDFFISILVRCLDPRLHGRQQRNSNGVRERDF